MLGVQTSHIFFYFRGFLLSYYLNQMNFLIENRKLSNLCFLLIITRVYNAHMIRLKTNRITTWSKNLLTKKKHFNNLDIK